MNVKPTTWIDYRDDARSERLWELYHENSKRRAFELERSAREEIPDSGYARSLPYPGDGLDLGEWMSARDIEAGSPVWSGELNMHQLAGLLVGAYGESMADGIPRRPVHSEGNRWSLELYVAVHDLTPLQRGLYYFNPEAWSLISLPGPCDALTNAVPVLAGKLPSAIILVTAVFARSTRYFGERGYRHCCLEAGEVIGRMRALADASGVSSAVALEFHDTSLNDMLGIDGVNHAVLGLVMIMNNE